MLMVIVDAHSKWPEVLEITLTTSELTIQALRGLFAVHGLPDQVVSDNGPQFVSKEFQQFMKENGIKHTRCAPYHPSSNGLAERFVQKLKKALRRHQRYRENLSTSLGWFPVSLSHYTACMQRLMWLHMSY